MEGWLSELGTPPPHNLDILHALVASYTHTHVKIRHLPVLICINHHGGQETFKGYCRWLLFLPWYKLTVRWSISTHPAFQHPAPFHFHEIDCPKLFLLLFRCGWFRVNTAQHLHVLHLFVLFEHFGYLLITKYFVAPFEQHLLVCSRRLLWGVCIQCLIKYGHTKTELTT